MLCVTAVGGAEYSAIESEAERMEAVERLKGRLETVKTFSEASAVLHWDQATYMPSKGTAARAGQLALLGTATHELFVDEETNRLLSAAEDEVAAAGLPDDDLSTCLVRTTRRDYRQACSLPSELVDEMSRTSSLAYQAWVDARAQNRYDEFRPWLERTFALARRQAEYLGYRDHPYDALLDIYEPNMTVERLEPLFSELRSGLVPLLETIKAQDASIDTAILSQAFDADAQLRFSKEITSHIGFDYERGRLDLTVHPFAANLGRDDVRITTRIEPRLFHVCLMGAIHEAGHGIYEQNLAPELTGTMLDAGASLGVHESQSRLWENIIGRSAQFWRHLFPLAQKAFPEQLARYGWEDMYRALNRVAPSFIRIEADEVTYNVHIMIRYEMEKRLIDGSLSFSEVPEAWNAAMNSYLGIVPPTDREGVLQDMHWSGGLIGYFPTYMIGNILSVQLYETATRADPEIPAGVASGDFGPLLVWLRENVHRYGRMYSPDRTIRLATDGALDIGPYMRYLSSKFGDLYNLGR